jgi:hypothetical protein
MRSDWLDEVLASRVQTLAAVRAAQVSLPG